MCILSVVGYGEAICQTDALYLAPWQPGTVVQFVCLPSYSLRSVDFIQISRNICNLHQKRSCTCFSGCLCSFTYNFQLLAPLQKLRLSSRTADSCDSEVFLAGHTKIFFLCNRFPFQTYLSRVVRSKIFPVSL